MKDILRDKQVVFAVVLTMLGLASLACNSTLPPEATNPSNNCDSIGAILDKPESLGKSVDVRGTGSTVVGNLHMVTGADGRKILIYDNEFLSSENFQGQYVSAKGTVIATKTGQVMISGFVYSTLGPDEICLPDNDGVLK